MKSPQNRSHRLIILIIGGVVLASGILLFFIPPALFPDPANGFQVLRSMQMGGSFNTLTAPDQSDIAQNYTEYLTWWTPGQYLVPWLFKLVSCINLGQAIALTVMLAQLCGLAGFYSFFKKAGFSPLIASLSLALIVCQLAFFVPYVFYNGGEVLLFAFEGWFLFGCVAFMKTDWKLALFVLLAGWAGFFFKSSFVWIYAAGLCCLWLRLSLKRSAAEWVKKALWIAIPAAVSLASIYVFFISKGQSPATVSKGLKLTAETFSFPLSAPLLSGFSLDDFFHGLIYHFGPPVFSHTQAIIILFVLALLSLLLIMAVIRGVHNDTYRLFVFIFYFGALLFFGFVYLRQLNISYEARHFRIIGLLLAPGIVSLVSRVPRVYQALFIALCTGIAVYSINYVVKGFLINNASARGATGIAQINIDQPSLNKLMQLDRNSRNATFVFIANDVGLEVTHNRIITLPPVADDLKIDMDDYRYEGFAGPLFIVLPETYHGPKEKMIMKAFPGYTGFNLSMLSDKYVLYEARMKR